MTHVPVLAAEAIEALATMIETGFPDEQKDTETQQNSDGES